MLAHPAAAAALGALLADADRLRRPWNDWLGPPAAVSAAERREAALRTAENSGLLAEAAHVPQQGLLVLPAVNVDLKRGWVSKSYSALFY